MNKLRLFAHTHIRPLAQVCLLLLLCTGMAGCGHIPFTRSNTVIPETSETIHNWTVARQFQAEGRYELARQHYSLALATVRTQSSMDMLKRELVAVDMQIRAMR